MKTTNWRWTNRRAIDFLLPMARDLVARFRRGEITLKPITNRQVTSARAWWEQNRFLRGPDGKQHHVVLTVTDWGDHDDRKGHIRVEVTLLLDWGKYDGLTVGWSRWQDKNGEMRETWGFQKEFRGMGNGYYADIDPRTGRIIRGEWD